MKERRVFHEFKHCSRSSDSVSGNDCRGSLRVFLKKQIGGNIQRIFTGFAAGVMVAASVWSLLIPAMDMCEEMGKLAFLPAVIGFLIGIVFCCSSIAWYPICMWEAMHRKAIRAV